MSDQDPKTPPVPPVVPPADPPSADPKPGANDENKFRRLHEKAEGDNAALKTRLAELEAAEKARKEGEMTELQKAQAEAAELKAKTAALEAENLRRKIAAEKGLAPDMLDFLSGDEAQMTAQAERLAGLANRPPAKAGTTTLPGGGQTPTVDEQIAAAQKANNTHEAIRLKRERAGFGNNAQ